MENKSRSSHADPGADQISPAEKAVPPSTAPRISYAAMARTGLVVTQEQTTQSPTRDEDEPSEYVHEERIPDVCFARPMLGFVLAVPYDKKRFLVDQVVKATLSTFPGILQLDHYRPGVIYIQFKTEAEKDQALSMEIPCSPYPLVLKSVVYSTGQRINIHTEHMQVSSPDDRTKAVEQVFGEYGEVIQTTIYWKGSRKELLPSFDFVLDIPQHTSKDLMLPRVAVILGKNHLFTWSGTPICYKCGEDDHIKKHCRKPRNFNMINAPPVASPIMARAFSAPVVPPHTTRASKPQRNRDSQARQRPRASRK
jgi:hypothetical protein